MSRSTAVAGQVHDHRGAVRYADELQRPAGQPRSSGWRARLRTVRRRTTWRRCVAAAGEPAQGAASTLKTWVFETPSPVIVIAGRR